MGIPDPHLAAKIIPKSRAVNLEAMQLLKHADLVYESRAVTWPRTHDVTYWRATRFGLVTLANGRAAVRQRIKDRTGL